MERLPAGNQTENATEAVGQAGESAPHSEVQEQPSSGLDDPEDAEGSFPQASEPDQDELEADDEAQGTASLPRRYGVEQTGQEQPPPRSKRAIHHGDELNQDSDSADAESESVADDDSYSADSTSATDDSGSTDSNESYPDIDMEA